MNRLHGIVPVALLSSLANPAMAQRRDWDIRVGALAMAMQRAVDFEGLQAVAEGLATGAEIAIGRGRIGVRVRLTAGELRAGGDSTASAAATLADIDARLQLRAGFMAFEAGLGRRAVAGRLATQSWDAVRLGGLAEWRAGQAPLFFVASASWVPLLWSPELLESGSAVEFESALHLRHARLPLWLALGYRLERRSLPGISGRQWEQISALLLGGGLATRRPIRGVR